MIDPVTQQQSNWPHFAAVALACATFPLIWVGGLVTTYDAGMAVPDWPTTYGYNMFLYPLSSWVTGPWDLFIEHGHRLLGSLVGLLTIALTVAIWRYDSRRWVRWMGLAALALVVFQGVLGGLRVRLESTDLARLHGCTGPLFFSLSVVMCVVTSRYWFGVTKNHDPCESSDRSGPPSNRMVVAAWFTFLLAYLQLVIGAHLRHPGIDWGPSLFRAVTVMHVVIAVFLVLQVTGIANTTRSFPGQLRRPALLMGGLVFCQFVLGIATWRAKYGWPSFIPIWPSSSLANFTVRAESMEQAITATSHVAVGSLILAASVCYATRLTRSCFLAAITDATHNQLPDSSKTPHTTPLTPISGTQGAVT